ncbi:MAG TPA: class I SAM-dependent methyltransferase [Caulobacteraceae bacterium]|jgi:SAM-dependent methyltransferase
MKPPYRKRKRGLGSIVLEGVLSAKHRRHKVEAFFDHDWSKIPFDRATVVKKLVSLTDAPRYLEIGCAENLLFDKVMAAFKVGVDPAQGGTHRMTSDAFFADNFETFDVVFIDGLHHYDQVRRDIVNALKVVRPGGWIALHDMFPRDWIEEHVPQIATSRWTGDGWKAAFELIASTGVDFRLVAIDHGVGIIRVLNEATSLADRQAELSPLRFAWFRDHFDELPVVDWPTAEAWIESEAA